MICQTNKFSVNVHVRSSFYKVLLSILLQETFLKY